MDKNKEVKKPEVKIERPTKRQIILETDGNAVEIIKAEVSGGLELLAIMQSVIRLITKDGKNNI